LARLVRNGFQGGRRPGRRKPTSAPRVSDAVSRAALRARIPTPVTDDRRPLFVSRSSCAIASPITLKKMTMRSPATHEPLMATMMTNSLAASSTVSAPAMTGRLRLGWNFRSLNKFWAHAIGGNVTRSYLRTSMLELRRPVLALWASLRPDRRQRGRDSQDRGVIPVASSPRIWKPRAVGDRRASALEATIAARHDDASPHKW
jgi:hypothetical protein